jgi:RNA polymerase sigma-70 factor (ECF subfamily)
LIWIVEVAQEDDAIVAGLRSGDATAFDAAYARYRARLYAFLARLGRDRVLAEDLLQETWLRLARHATRLEVGTELGAWLFTVARNLWVSHRRWRVVDAARLRALAGRAGGGATPDTPFEIAAAAETERRVERAIGALAPAHREVLLLVAVEHFTPAEAARIVGATPETVRQRLARARAMIARQLAEEGPL